MTDVTLTNSRENYDWCDFWRIAEIKNDWCDFWRTAEKIVTDVTFDEQQRKLWLMWLLTNSCKNYDWCDFWRITSKCDQYDE
jgi:hypothetical protein